MTAIQVGDVCLDLAQGRPVHVVEQYDGTAAEWSDANGYELTDNYGNSRLGATDDDAVFQVVFCSNAKSQPSKTYAMPEARLLRIETEAADDGRPVRERIVIETLATVLSAVRTHGNQTGREADMVREWLAEFDAFDDELLAVADELAEVEHTIVSEGDDD